MSLSSRHLCPDQGQALDKLFQPVSAPAGVPQQGHVTGDPGGGVHQSGAWLPLPDELHDLLLLGIQLVGSICAAHTCQLAAWYGDEAAAAAPLASSGLTWLEVQQLIHAEPALGSSLHSARASGSWKGVHAGSL